MDRFDSYHEQVEQELENGDISPKEAYEYHKEIEEEEREHYG